MKKLFLAITLCFTFSSFANELLPVKTGPLDFPSTIPGVIYSNASRAMYREQKVDLKQYNILGKVESKAIMENVLLLCNWGDTSLGTLKRNALAQYPHADDIVNIEIDVHSFNVLLAYIKTTVTLRGIAVQFKK